MIKPTLKIEYTYFLILIFVLIWCLLILTAPFLASQQLKLQSAFIYLFFSKICHQQPDRSFFIWGKQFAVCVRCSGLYFGFLIGTLLFPLVRSFKNFNQHRRYLFFIAVIPITIDLLLTIFRIWQNTFFSRFGTGLFLGTVVALFVIAGICNLRREMKYTR